MGRCTKSESASESATGTSIFKTRPSLSFSPAADTRADRSQLYEQGVPLQNLAAASSPNETQSSSFSVTGQRKSTSVVRPLSRSPRCSSRSRSSSSSKYIPGHDPATPSLIEAIAEPTLGRLDRLDLQLDEADMASKKTPILRAVDGSRPTSSPYGSVTVSQDASPASSDSEEDNNHHRLRRIGSQNRSQLSLGSRRSMTSWRSEDLDGTALMSGLEGRFGIAESAFPSEILDHDEDDEDIFSDHGPLLEDASSTDSTIEPEENSPHELVRASVAPTDNTTLSINTPRMWCLSVLFSILGSSTNLFFSLRYPSVAITPVIALLLVHPLGHLWDMLLKRPNDPDLVFVDGVRTETVNPGADETHQTKHRISWRQWLAQGKWNEKEHTCVYVSSNVAFGFAFATDVIVEQTQFYNQPASIGYQLLLTISTQILGYGFAGMARRFLVRPSGMVWPGTLMSAAMFSTLHKQDNKPANGWTISRWKFFYMVWSGAFAFYFLPGLLMPALSYFSVVTWFAPKNVVIANLFGVASGLGLFPMTFDWAQITYVGSPLLVPFWAAMNVIGGLAIVMWIVAPVFYYANVLYTSYLPILSTGVFDNTGKIYDVSKILTSEFLFDKDAYKQYSRVFLPVTYMLSYGMQFAGLAALLTHTLCWHGRDILRTWKKSMEEARQDSKPTYRPVPESYSQPASSSTGSLGSENYTRTSASTSNVDNLISREDVHCRLMSRYKDAPLSWYLLTFASMTAIGMFIVEYYPVHLPWYGLLLSLSIGAIFFIPNGIIMAVTNQHSSIYLICQLICGAVFPGRPIANMVFVTYGYISSAQGIKFASDLKLGHYMKIPPRIMFLVQVVATLVSSVTQIGVLNWMFANVKGICTADALNGFTCPIARVHFNGSILWGVVGPGEFFGPGAIYRALVWCFPLGALLPIPLWLYARNRRRSVIRKVNLPVIFGAMSWIPPATGLNFSVWAVVCYVFNYLIKRRADAWWSKYTMTLSAALDSGLAFGIVVVFFGFVYPGLMKHFKWWGTEVYKQGCDWQACSYRTVPEGQTFGPGVW
ncbi:Oligopeptide transporter OPT superfamily [Metarhizium album ARSEF 1941]|uniref:Oligopeptide transporter OPT superfamily n=1 Tax=Metarhizium album (strain ARSEF 1941) TaxID=1081103 RepID=A0A0B2WJU1_METAS|nr:Oligopeptide transporter OPT superfamily [Metarhizium album ARSEF 1941]KHN94208.1 Oligopeptide transporter OPT superfamily [Metarhizium album ARSEF 1941]